MNAASRGLRRLSGLLVFALFAALLAGQAAQAAIIVAAAGAGSGTIQGSALVTTHGHDPGGALYAPAGVIAPASAAMSTTAIWIIVGVVAGAAAVSSWLVIRRRHQLTHMGCEYSAAGC